MHNVNAPTNLNDFHYFITKFTHLLTPWSRVLLEKLTSSQLDKKFPAFYETPRFITALTSAHHLSLSSASSIQSIPPHPTSWRSILMLSSDLCLSLPCGLSPSGFPTNTLYTPLLSPIRTTRTSHLILLYFITWTVLGEQYSSLSSSLYEYSFLHSRYLIPLRARYSPQHPILKHPQPAFLPQCERPIQNNRQNYSSEYLNLHIFG